VIFLPTFTTLCGFQNSSHTFMAATLAKVRLGKLWLETKQALHIAADPNQQVPISYSGKKETNKHPSLRKTKSSKLNQF
jgi:hypothetical protein